MNRRRRGIVLLLVLVSLAIAAALITPLALLSGVGSLAADRQADTLRHRLAAESIIAMLPELLSADRDINADLDRDNQSHLSFDVGAIHVDALLQDDSAKLPVSILFASKRINQWRDALSVLSARCELPALEFRNLPSQGVEVNPSGLLCTGCLDDLFEAPADAALFGQAGQAAVWSRYLAPIGQTVNLYRADPAVLEACCFDIQPGLGTRLADARHGQAKPDPADLIARLELPEPQARALTQRLNNRTERFSVLIRTRIASETRQRYVVCTADTPPAILANWEVAR